MKYRNDIPGLKIRHNSRGYCVVELDFIADRAKRDPKWAKAQRRRYPQDRDWQREMKRNWTVASGDAFFPEFQLKPEIFLHPIKSLLPSPVARGWDFGFRCPSCVWMQLAPSGRVAFLREIVPEQIDIHNFRDLVLYLSGELEYRQLERRARRRAIEIVELILAKNEYPWTDYPDPPWFENMRFIDFAGHEATATRSITGEAKERNDAEVLQNGGIELWSQFVRPSAREYVFRRMMGLWPDGWPGMLLDSTCVVFYDCLNGGLCYPKPTKMVPQPMDPQPDGYYENIYDAAGYSLSNLVAVTEENAIIPNYEWQGRLLVRRDDIETQLSYLNRR